MISNISFIKSPIKNKKYRVFFMFNNNRYFVDFGDKRYQQYYDSTPLKLYSHLDHLNDYRRYKYLSRARGIKNKNGILTKDDPFKANYWSINYLW